MGVLAKFKHDMINYNMPSSDINIVLNRMIRFYKIEEDDA